MWKIHGEKNHGERERDSTKSKDYKEFSKLYYKFDSLGFDPLLRRKRSAFIAEG